MAWKRMGEHEEGRRKERNYMKEDGRGTGWNDGGKKEGRTKN